MRIESSNVAFFSRPLHPKARSCGSSSVYQKCPHITSVVRTCVAVSHPRPSRNVQRYSSSGFTNPEVREAAKRLTELFYRNTASTASPRPPGNDVGAPRALDHRPSNGVDAAFHNLPLWRADTVVLVGQQALLHVHTPHYVHMFDSLFNAASPDGCGHLFGHVHLPAGSRNLGSPEWALCAQGSRAPTTGVLMEVNRAVRLEDGKVMVLATALCRIQVLHCWQETPYSRARVVPLHEKELLEVLGARATETALDAAAAPTTWQPAGDGGVFAADRAAGSAGAHGRHVSPTPTESERPCRVPGTSCVGAPPMAAGSDVSTILRLAAALAQAAATAEAWHWQAYEVGTARSSSWRARCPVEGSDPTDTRRLVTDLVDHGVLSVVPLPDGPVVGRWDLKAVGQAAEAAAKAAMQVAARAALQSPAVEAATAAGSGAGADSTEQHGGSVASGPDSLTVSAGAEEGTPLGRGVGTSTDAGSTGASGTAPVVEGQSGLAAGVDGVQSGPAGPFSIEETATWLRAVTDTGVQLGAGPDSRPAPATPPDEGTLMPPAATSSPSGAADDMSRELSRLLTGNSRYDLLVLEASLWSEMDALASLQAQVNKQRLGLPLGLLQLRPSDELFEQQMDEAAPPGAVPLRIWDQLAPEGASGQRSGSGTGLVVHAGGASSESSEQSRLEGGVKPRMHPASDGLDVYCNPDYPIERRVMRLSYAAASIFIEGQDSAARQLVLEQQSVRARLIGILQRARKARNMLAAMAAVKALRPGL